MNEQPVFNYRSQRARQARLRRRIAPSDIYWVLLLVGLVVAVGGVAIVWYMRQPWGWALAGLSGLFWVFAAYGRFLRDLPPKFKGTSVDDLLDADVLGGLPPLPTPHDLAEAILRARGGDFMAARLGIGPFLTEHASQQQADTQAVWQEALQLHFQLGLPSINAATLAAALLRRMPNYTAELAKVRLGDEDILAGVRWFAHFETLLAQHATRKRDGGIGRDWSFGYTPLLSRFGFNLSEDIGYNGLLTSDLPSRQTILSEMMKSLSAGARRNAVLVGQLGSGKTTSVHTLAQKLLTPGEDVPVELHYRQIIALDPARLIAEAKERGELEELVQRLCSEAAAAKNIILFLDDAQLFFEEGMGAVDLGNVLMPILEAGGLMMIMAMDEQRWTKISQANPALSQYLNRIMLPPADKDETMLAMQDELILLEYEHKVVYMYQALEAAYRLSSRYLSDQAMPGRAVKLLESSAGFANEGFVTQHSVEQAIEQTQGVKVDTASNEDERQVLLNLEQLIHARMINQSRAVQVVSDALRRARAGVRNTERPIGTFLFLGPTGVGKTELAKSLAAVYFGGEDHLVRVDLNEYVGPNDVERLIADASQDEHSLTAQIAHQPFSVVLLDEIEKAHPNVLNTLLQMLDEGILRDINNRQVNFRDAIIIATSNAGAELIRRRIESGQQLEQFEQQFTDELVNANVFRPEFLNRFDEIVLFRPLNQDELLQVVDLILQGINKGLEAQKVSVSVDLESRKLLVASGYDPRLGARPMRRVVQRVVENIVANQMLASQAAPGSEIKITVDQVKQMLERHDA